MFPKDALSQKLMARANACDPLPNSGTVIDRSKNLMRVIYDFTVNGGAVGTIPLVDDQGNAAILPQGAIVTNVTAHVLVAGTTSASGTLALGSNISAATTDLMGATAMASLTLGAFVAGTPVGTAATWKGPVTAVAGSQIQATIATGALTAGKVAYLVEYVVSTLA
jgi:hypothetical protein